VKCLLFRTIGFAIKIQKHTHELR